MKEGAVCIAADQDAGAVGVSAALKAVIFERTIGSCQETGDRVQCVRPPLYVALVRQAHGVS